MLTRFEVSGFKNLENVTVDFGPFTCIAGPNSVGKSNLFDAIEFLSLLSDHNFLEACTLIRPTPQQRSDISSLFLHPSRPRPRQRLFSSGNDPPLPRLR
ncbi:AAA family ATPase [Schaalia georgiae]|uniref:AAA family ATPase n=1 Tax=Schaalia georgiae TaxID=52768 RepID=UPI0004010791